jgi:hypothetical protein
VDRDLHPDFQLLLDFYREQRRKPPQTFTHGPAVAPNPSVFSVARLQHHLNDPLLTPSWVTVLAQGRIVPLESSCLMKIVQNKELFFMDKTLINEQISRGAAILLEGLDILDPQINAFVGELDAGLPCALSNCVAFFSQRQNEAYQGHCDTDDVLVLQLAGEKRWRIFTPQQRRYVDNFPLDAQQLGRQIAELTLRAGDALYVRAGVPHLCETPGDYSLHLSFDLCDRTPNIEQITHEANSRYNRSCEEQYAPASRVAQRYVSLLKSDKFRNDLELATKKVKSDAVVFRKRISGTSAVTALGKFVSDAERS